MQVAASADNPFTVENLNKIKKQITAKDRDGLKRKFFNKFFPDIVDCREYVVIFNPEIKDIEFLSCFGWVYQNVNVPKDTVAVAVKGSPYAI